jgi:3-polyprenyl-4-hydroxybenzoate decarboxylase
MQKAVRKEQTTQAQASMDLRSTLEWLKTEGDLIETDKEVDPDLQVTGLQKSRESRTTG